MVCVYIRTYNTARFILNIYMRVLVESLKKFVMELLAHNPLHTTHCMHLILMMSCTYVRTYMKCTLMKFTLLTDNRIACK